MLTDLRDRSTRTARLAAVSLSLVLLAALAPLSTVLAAPGPPSAPVLSPASDSGVKGDNMTNDATPTFTGISDPSVTIKLYNSQFQPPVLVGTGFADATGHWSVTTGTLVNGGYRMSATAYDASGAASIASGQTIVIIDLSAPLAPATPILDPASDSAPTGDNTTTDTTPTVYGPSIEWNTIVSVYLDGAVTGTVSPGLASTWSYTLPTLTSGTHTVAVNATDLAGNVGPQSARLTLTIGSAPASTVPGAPTLNSATAGNAQVSLSWTAPASNGGSAITGYRLYRGAAAGAETLYGVLGTATSYTDTGLSNGLTYYYKVSAVNSVGEGVKSNEQGATPQATVTAPGAPTLNSASAGNAQVSLSWTAPSSNGGSAITGYRLYRGTAAGAETLYGTLGTGTTYLNTGLSNGTTYFYKVSAVNSAGEGVKSNEQAATPQAGATVPGAPTIYSATAGNAQVSLSWTAPSSNGGSAITGYRLYRGTAAGAETLYGVLGTATSYTDSGLSNGVTYYYKVSAVNAVGEGARSNEQAATPKASATVPGAPSGLLAAPAKPHGITLSWLLPSTTGGSPITGYRIYRSTLSGAETLYTTLANITTYLDTATTRGVTYFYRVAAINAIGTSPTSAEASAVGR